ncbi:MAG: hypothetical protein AB1540_11710 [Bdellovibrionota bacterium]
MFFYRYKPYFLMALIAFCSSCGGLALSPNHHAKFTFQGKVVTETGLPVPNAWVKVRGWETLTDSQGRWKQEQVVKCGALREHPSSHVEEDAVLVTAPGFEPAEESFDVKHPAWFSSCEADQVLAFETVLKPEGSETEQNRDATKFKERKESPAIPWPDPKSQAKKKNSGKGIDL